MSEEIAGHHKKDCFRMLLFNNSLEELTKTCFYTSFGIYSATKLLSEVSIVSLSHIYVVIIVGHMILPVFTFCYVIGQFCCIPKLSKHMAFTRAFTSPLFFICCFFTPLRLGKRFPISCFLSGYGPRHASTKSNIDVISLGLPNVYFVVMC